MARIKGIQEILKAFSDVPPEERLAAIHETFRELILEGQLVAVPDPDEIGSCIYKFPGICTP